MAWSETSRSTKWRASRPPSRASADPRNRERINRKAGRREGREPQFSFGEDRTKIRCLRGSSSQDVPGPKLTRGLAGRPPQNFFPPSRLPVDLARDKMTNGTSYGAVRADALAVRGWP